MKRTNCPTCKGHGQIMQEILTDKDGETVGTKTRSLERNEVHRGNEPAFPIPVHGYAGMTIEAFIATCVAVGLAASDGPMSESLPFVVVETARRIVDELEKPRDGGEA